RRLGLSDLLLLRLGRRHVELGGARQLGRVDELHDKRRVLDDVAVEEMEMVEAPKPGRDADMEKRGIDQGPSRHATERHGRQRLPFSRACSVMSDTLVKPAALTMPITSMTRP